MRTLSLKVPGEAPTWTSNFASSIEDFVRNMFRGPQGRTSYSKAKLPDATKYTGADIYVTDDVGGAVPAFSDGSNWRRVTDRNIIS